MKKLLTILFLFSFCHSFGQFDQKQTLGNSKTTVVSKGLLAADSGIIVTRFVDTSVANLAYLKNIPGIIITVGDDVYIRNAVATAWLKVNKGGTDNSNLGSYFRLLVPATQQIKSIANGIAVLVDSTTFPGALLLSADTSYLFGIARANIRDTLNANKLYVQSGYGVGDSAAYFPNDSTLRFKDFVLGWGMLPHATSDTTFGSKPDTGLISTKANVQKVVNDSSAVLRALIGSGGGVPQTPWLQDINAKNYSLDSLQKIHIQTRTGAGGGTTYATWNPADKAAGMTLSGGNLAATGSGGGQEMVRGTDGKSSGKWYFEVTLTSGTAFRAGIAQAGESLTDYLGFGANGYSYEDGGNKVNNATATAYGPAISTGNTIGVMVDLDAGTLSFKDNTGAVIGTAFTGLTGTFYPALSNGFSSSTQTANFGATAFVHSVPSGYNAGWYTSSSGSTYTTALRTNDAAQVFVGDSSAATTEKFNVNGNAIVTGTLTANTALKSPYLYGGDMSTTYAGFQGAILGGTANHAVLDFVGYNTRIGEIYTSPTALNIWTDIGKSVRLYTNNVFGLPLLAASNNQNIGIKDSVPNSTLTVNGSLSMYYTTVSSNYTVLDRDYSIFASGTITISLPTAAGCAGRIYIIKNTSTGAITIDPDGSETIDGSSTKILTTQNETAALQSNGTNWHIIATGGSSAASLTTPRNINGVPFDGTADITIAETETKVKFFTDFITAATTASPPFVFSAISTGTTASNNTNLSGNAPGVQRLTSSTTANGGYRILTDLTTIRIKGGEEYTVRFAPVNISTTTFRAGFLDATTSADAADGIYFEYTNSGDIVLKTANNSTRTTSSVITTASLNTWYKGKIVVNSNATSVTGYIYDASGTLISSQTITTNIPTGSGREVGVGVIATESTTTATAMVDLDFILSTLSPVR